MPQLSKRGTGFPEQAITYHEFDHHRRFFQFPRVGFGWFLFIFMAMASAADFSWDLGLTALRQLRPSQSVGLSRAVRLVGPSISAADCWCTPHTQIQDMSDLYG